MLVSHYDRGHTAPIKEEHAISKAIVATRGRTEQFEVKEKNHEKKHLIQKEELDFSFL